MQKMFHLFLMSLLLVSRWTQSRRSPSTGSPCASKWKSWWNDGRECRNQVLFKFASRGWWVVEKVTLVTFLSNWSGDSIMIVSTTTLSIMSKTLIKAQNSAHNGARYPPFQAGQCHQSGRTQLFYLREVGANICQEIVLHNVTTYQEEEGRCPCLETLKCMRRWYFSHDATL